MITPAEQELFSRDFTQALQQKGTKLRPRCQVKFFNEGIKAEMFKRLGETEAEDKDSRNSDTPVMSTPMDHRWVVPRPFHWGDLFDETDIRESIGDPTGPVIQAGAYAMGRKLDRGRVIPCMFGSAPAGDHGSSTVVFPTDGSQDIAVTVGATASSSATSMNVDKFVDAFTLMMGNEVDMEVETITCAMSYLDLRGLMKDTKFTSKDYRDAAVYDNKGMLKSFLGVDILVINGLQTNTAGYRQCPMWCSSGIGLGIWLDETMDMAKDPTKQFKWRVYKQMNAGAARLDEKKVARILTTADGTIA